MDVSPVLVVGGVVVNNSLWIIEGVNMLIVVMILLMGLAFLIAPEVIALTAGVFATSYVLGSLMVPTFNPEWSFWIAMIVLIVTSILKGYYNVKFNNTSRIMNMFQGVTPPTENDTDDNNF